MTKKVLPPLLQKGLGWAKQHWPSLAFIAVLLGLLLAYLCYVVKTQFGLVMVPQFKLPEWKAYALVLGGLAIALVGVAYACTRLFKAKAEHLFLVLCIGFGCLYSLLLPPNSVPDEVAHISTAYRFSNVLLGGEFTIEGETFAVREDDLAVLLFPAEFTFEHNLAVINGLETPLQSTAQVKATVPDVGNVLLYLPQILAVTLARLLNLGGMQLVYLGRLFNLLLYAAAGFVTLRKMNAGKLLFSLVALLPISLQQAGSFSYDVTIAAAGLVLMGNFVRLMLDKTPLTRADMVLLCIAGGLFGSAKYGVYIPLLFLLFFLPKERFAGRCTKKQFAFIFAGVVATLFLAINIPNYFYQIDVANAADSGSTTLLGVLQGPFQMFPLLINSLGFLLGNFWADTFGGMLGQYYKFIDIAYIVGFFSLIFLAAFPQREHELYLSKPVRLGMLGASLLSFLMLALAAFSWTSTGSLTLTGIQGRYFLPFLPLVFLALQNGSILTKPRLQARLLPAAAVLHFFVVMELLTSLFVLLEAPT